MRKMASYRILSMGVRLVLMLALFISELSAHGGPLLDTAELRLHLHCYVATIGLAMMMDAPALILSRLPEAVSAHSPLDPLLPCGAVLSPAKIPANVALESLGMVRWS